MGLIYEKESTIVFIPNNPIENENNEESNETSNINNENEITGQTVLDTIRENKWQSITILIIFILISGFIYFKYIKKTR